MAGGNEMQMALRENAICMRNEGSELKDTFVKR